MLRARFLPVILLVAIAAVLVIKPPVHAANNSEQVVFSGTGSGTLTSSGATAPVGFWVWCTAEAAPSSRGEYPNEHECAGAMYFYSLGLTKHVSGEVSEPEEGIYRMDLHSADNSVACVLANASEEVFHGPSNIVEITCTAPGFTGSSNSAVVNVTGPKHSE